MMLWLVNVSGFCGGFGGDGGGLGGGGCCLGARRWDKRVWLNDESRR